ncbi:hypothetical protein [Brevibacterium zhoupengii]|uniref:hypothetical protein n=1 Tax=Brevibacterium zhoupengii TaxID=2898795 RepID=UPI001F098889|nr:hypothetical protein [Brevibacterium zhoupengii]
MSESTSVFGPEIPKQKKQRLPLTKTQIILGVAGVLIFAVSAWAIVASILPTEGMKQEAAYEACTEDARSQLRDPDSAQFELKPGTMDSKAGHTVYTFDGHVRSRNGFGGMTSNTMMCIGKWDDDKGESDMSAVLLPSM